MGVPAMFRWLSKKYPKIVSGVVEELPKEVDGEQIPVDRCTKNPNGEEFDNLYLDMNGIVHPCSHPEDKKAPRSEAAMMLAIFEYTDRVVGMVRPRKLLYLAVDGVAPRAKMNQQRSRRFRSAKEAKEKDEEAAEFRKMLNSQKASRGEDINTLEEVVEKTWDSNAITPGTPFMFLLAESLQYWCAYKYTTDPSWQDMKVIISDSSVPGEGEHKIMNFIRSQRALPTHNPNTRHVIYGLDADLIMLGLATHEPHFRVLREDVFYDSGKDKRCTKCGRMGHEFFNCTHDGARKLTEDEANQEWAETAHPPKPFIWLHVNVLREYLALEMDAPGRKFTYNLERALDDWVFMCFFVGNDFLPHLPSLEIRDQGIDTLLTIWRSLVPQMNDYVTNNGSPDMVRVQQILEALASREPTIFKKRKEQSERQKANRERREAEKERVEQRKAAAAERNGQPPYKRIKEDTNTYLNSNVPFFDPKQAQSNEVRNVHHDMMADRGQSNKSAAAKLKELMKAKAQGDDDGKAQAEDASESSTSIALGKRKSSAMEDLDSGTPGRKHTLSSQTHSMVPAKKNDEMPEDTIKLWEPGYEERYYEQKFHVTPDDIEFRHKVGREYAKGLCWVLAYYMQGCPSWTWYFPYHYAPFATDFKNLETLDPSDFDKGKPFKPYEQLMGVLPAASNHAIPEPFRILMSDPNSSILDFYPEDFPIDLNGKKFAWQGVAILPFIDEKRLLDAMNTKYPELSDDEHRRNETGHEILMFSQNNQLFHDVNKAFYQSKPEEKLEIDPKQSHGLHGSVTAHDDFVVDSSLVAPFDSNSFVDAAEREELQDTEYFHFEGQDNSIKTFYTMPVIKSKYAHKSKLLDGVTMPTKALTPDDEEHVKRGGGRGGRGGRGGFNGGGRGRRDNGHGYGRESYNGGGRGYQGSRSFDGPAAGYGAPQPTAPQFGQFPPPMSAQRGNGPPPGWQSPPGFQIPPGFPPPGFQPPHGFPPSGFQPPPGFPPPGFQPPPGFPPPGMPLPPPGWNPGQSQQQRGGFQQQSGGRGRGQQRPDWMNQSGSNGQPRRSTFNSNDFK